MNEILDFLGNSNAKKMIIEKHEIISETTVEDRKKLDIRLTVEIITETLNETVKKVAVSEYLGKWMRDFKFNVLKPSSYDRNEKTIKYQIEPFIGDIPLDELKTDDVQGMINQLKDDYAFSTIKKAYDCINECLKFAVKRRDLSHNVAETAVLPKVMEYEEKEVKFFEDNEVELIEAESVRCYKNGKSVYRLGNMVIFLLNTGLRIGEALALKWTDIDFEKRTVKIRKNVIMVKDRDEDAENSYILIEQNSTKSKSGSRIVPLNTDAFNALKRIHSLNGKREKVLSTSKGGCMYPRNADRMFRSILKRCGLNPEGVHTLRHTFASRLFENGVDVKTVSSLLGHADVRITYDTYIHLIQAQHVTAVETLEKISSK